jgi:hypothetical protein
VSDEVMQVATPVVGFTALEHPLRAFPLSVKLIVPEKVVAPEAPETVAVNVTV